MYLLFLIPRACDNDEEFMLIEAADHLPGWLNPETADKRVCIHSLSFYALQLTLYFLYTVEKDQKINERTVCK